MILKGIFRNFGGMDPNIQGKFDNGKYSFSELIAKAFNFSVANLSKKLKDPK